MIKLFRPILTGASLRDRVAGSLGGLFGIAVMSVLAWLLIDPAWSVPLVVAPMGASAVLIFAVPTSPLAQPWPVIGGNVISALVGITAAKFVPGASLSAGVAVGGAILVMSLLRCLHPPGGAAALTAVIGGPAVASAGYAFAFIPVGVNAMILTAAGLLFHRLSGHSYPHRAALPPGTAPTSAKLLPHPEDVDRALADVGEAFDISRDDLDLLLQRMEHHALERTAAAR